MIGTDRIELLDADHDDITIEWEGTWKEFAEDNINAGMEPEELRDISDTLDRFESYVGGGGASSLFILRRRSS